MKQKGSSWGENCAGRRSFRQTGDGNEYRQCAHGFFPAHSSFTMQKDLSVLKQIRTAFNFRGKTRGRNILAALLGFSVGFFVPFGTFTLVHMELAQWTGGFSWRFIDIPAISLPLALVLGGLTFSAKSVYQWMSVLVSGDQFKAIGITVLLEGIMTFSKTHYLTYGAFVLIAVANMVTMTVQLAMERQTTRRSKRPARRQLELNGNSPKKEAPKPAVAVSGQNGQNGHSRRKAVQKSVVVIKADDSAGGNRLARA